MALADKLRGRSAAASGPPAPFLSQSGLLQQRNGFDCGVYVCIVAETVADWLLGRAEGAAGRTEGDTAQAEAAAAAAAAGEQRRLLSELRACIRARCSPQAVTALRRELAALIQRRTDCQSSTTSS